MSGLDAKLAGAGVDAGVDPITAFAELHAAIGEEATVLDRYELEARSRGVPVAELTEEERRDLGAEVLAVRGYEMLGATGGGRVEVVPYDPGWPGRFHWKRGVMRAALGPAAGSIDHMGSTAVPGLAAKPVIDILVSISDVEDEESYRVPLERTGLQFRSRDEVHRYFRPPAGSLRDVQVHVAEADSDWRREHLLFRDYLRAHSDVADAYGALKLRLAAEHPTDRIAYTDMKGAFIREALVDAAGWAARTGWTS